MLITAKQTQVLIVGAGPSGMMMAAQLLRYGVQPIIIDSREGPTSHSKAIAVQARTLEIYQQMGIVAPALNNGKAAQGVTFYQDGKRVPSVLFYDIGKHLTRFPYLLMYPQNKNERLLLDNITQNCCPVYWNTTLISLEQNTDTVKVALKNGDAEFHLTCDWLVGADGAHSTVRRQNQLSFSGDTYAHHFYLIDAQLNAPDLIEDHLNLFINKHDVSGFFPMPDKDNYRIIGNLPVAFDEREDLTAEEVLPHIKSTSQENIKIIQNNWFSTYKLHHRMANNFRSGRCFLIGDAAHIHSPVGGQGMNTGLQDAYNLAWKMAGVINGQMRLAILDSYAAERMPVAKSLLKTTDTIFNMIMSGNVFIGLFKKFALFPLLNAARKSEQINTIFFKRISQIDISYRNSSINLHLSKATKVKAGDRLPYIKLYDEKQLAETDLHEWCGKSGFTLIILGKFDELFIFTIARWITQKYPGILNFFYLPPSGKNLDVFKTFECNPHQQKALIIRPDMHIGYLNDVVDIAMMNNYLQNVMLLVHG